MATLTSLGFSIYARYKRGGLQQAAEDLDKFQSRSERLGSSLTSMGEGVSTRVSAPLIGIGVTALKMSGDFEAAMNGVRAVTGATGDDFDGLRNLAKDLGSTTAFSASEAAAGMEFLGMAGWNTNQILSGMPDILNLAAAGNVQLADAANTASNIMAGFGIEAEESGRVADALAAACASANVDLSMLGETMKVAAPAAASAGWSLEQTAAAAGMLGNAGIQGETAGTGLTSAILGMMDASSAASKTLRDLGVSTLDSNGNLRDMSAILIDLEKAGANAVDMGRIFGADHGPKMAALLGQGSEALKELEDGLLNVEGAAETMAAIRMEGLNGELKTLQSAFEGLMIAIGDTGLLSMATSLVSRLGELTQAAANANPTLLKWGVLLGAVLAAAGPVLWVTGQMVTAIGQVSAAVKFLLPLIKAASLALWASPWTWAVVGVLALAGALVWAYKTFDGFRAIVDSGAGTLRDVFGWLVEWAAQVRAAFAEGGIGGAVSKLGEQAGPILATLMDLREVAFDGALSLFGAIVDALPVLVPQLVAALSGMLQQVVTTLVSAAPLVLQAGVQLLTGLVDAAVAVLPIVVEGLVSILTALLGAVVEALPLLLEAGTTLLRALIDGMVTFLPLVVEFVFGQMWPTMLGALMDLLPELLDAGVDLMMTLVDGLTTTLPVLVALASELIPRITQTLSDMLPRLVETGVDMLLKLTDGMIRATPQLVALALTLLPTVVSTLMRFMPMLLSVGFQVIGSLVMGIGRAIPQLARTVIVEVIPAILMALRRAGGSLVRAGWDIISGLARGIKDAVSGVLRPTLNWVTGLIPNFKGPRPVDLQLLQPAGRDIMTGLASGITDGVPGVRRALGDVTREIPSMARPTGALPPPGTAGAAAGGGRVEVVIHLDGDEDMVRMFRKAVRVRGGDVQAVLGGVR
ncbi:phage tail tape measure protein [Streptomyces calidiresistens]|uniref:Phage tail tape measure protein n=1 Tax=Streptomyces calidiresistens TaxID=1485586 RepID=A0A7W3T073_9ACTN|nr:phage tail tape measure protein [Streptomyces calidiresistens]MBB0228510.1 phage tail tape measure protein [Streptomyces calidiresistens]